MRAAALATGVLALAAFGCGGSSPSSPTTVPQQSELTFTSAPGDFIGGGRNYRFTQGDATFQNAVDPAYPGSIVINVQSNDRRSYWSIYMGARGGEELRVGTFENAERWTAAVGSRPRFTLSGDGRGCGDSEARFEIRTLTHRGTVRVSSGATVPLIERLHVFFSQRCTATSAPGLTGELFYIATP